MEIKWVSRLQDYGTLSRIHNGLTIIECQPTILTDRSVSINMKELDQNSTREMILDLSIRLMLENGYHATSINDIMQGTGITKAGFFYHFSKKEDLASEALDYFFRPMQALLDNDLADQNDDPLEQIFTYIDHIIEGISSPTEQASCLFGNFAQELSTSHPRLREQCDQMFDSWAGVLEEALNRAQEKYSTNGKLNTRSLAEHLIAVYEGSLILAKSKQDKSVLREHFEHYKRYLFQCFEQSDRRV